MLPKSWDDEKAPAAMMRGDLKGQLLFRFIQIQVIGDIWQRLRQQGLSSHLNSK
jgi:hypothetical protein